MTPFSVSGWREGGFLCAMNVLTVLSGMIDQGPAEVSNSDGEARHGF